MKWAVPSWGDAECAAVIRRLIGLSGPSARPSLLLQQDVLEKCEGGCLARDDYRDARKFRNEEYERVVGVKIGGLNWLKSKAFITDEEYQEAVKQIQAKAKPKTSGEHSPGGDVGAAATGEAPAPKRKVDREDEEWVRANVLPRVPGCTVQHIVNHHVGLKWTVAYPGCNTCSRNYGAAKGIASGRTSRTAMNCVLPWVWQRHIEKPEKSARGILHHGVLEQNGAVVRRGAH